MVCDAEYLVWKNTASLDTCDVSFVTFEKIYISLHNIDYFEVIHCKLMTLYNTFNQKQLNIVQ